MDAEFDALHGELSCHKAVSTALIIERSMTERGFYAVVTSDSNEFQIISKRLIELTNVHIAKVEKEVQRVLCLGESAKKNIPLKD